MEQETRPSEVSKMQLHAIAAPPKVPSKSSKHSQVKGQHMGNDSKNKSKTHSPLILEQTEVEESKECEEDIAHFEHSLGSIADRHKPKREAKKQIDKKKGDGLSLVDDEGEWVLLQDQKSKQSFYLNVFTGDAHWKRRQDAKRIVQRYDSEGENDLWITLKAENSSRPMFSSVQSPKSIRRRLRRFFIDNHPHGVVDLPELIENSEFASEEDIFRAIQEMPDHGAMEWKASLVVSQSSESNVRFASFVEEIRTDTSGYVIGCDLVRLKEEVPPEIQPSGMKRKRRVKRMSKEVKRHMFSWREDLKPARKKKGMSLLQLQKLSKCRVRCPVPTYNPGLPIWPPTEREELLIAQKLFYAGMETPPLRHRANSPWTTKTSKVCENKDEDLADQEVALITSNRTDGDEHRTREM